MTPLGPTAAIVPADCLYCPPASAAVQPGDRMGAASTTKRMDYCSYIEQGAHAWGALWDGPAWPPLSCMHECCYTLPCLHGAPTLVLPLH